MYHIYHANDIANYIISKCENDGAPISNLQLQKILYYVQREPVSTFVDRLSKD